MTLVGLGHNPSCRVKIARLPPPRAPGVVGPIGYGICLFHCKNILQACREKRLTSDNNSIVSFLVRILTNYDFGLPWTEILVIYLLLNHCMTMPGLAGMTIRSNKTRHSTARCNTALLTYPFPNRLLTSLVQKHLNRESKKFAMTKCKFHISGSFCFCN